MNERESKCAGRANAGDPARADGPLSFPTGSRRTDASPGGLAHMPLSDGEAHLMRGVAQAARDRHARAALTDRYRFLREAMGLGVGCDPDVLDGLDHVLDGLRLLGGDGERDGRRGAGTDGTAPARGRGRAGRGAPFSAPDLCARPDLEASLRRYGSARLGFEGGTPRD